MEWISIKEKLPDKYENVLLYTPLTLFGKSHLCIGNRSSISACKAKLSGSTVPLFTHWMSLPNTPCKNDLVSYEPRI